jgi:hypothetical protein
MSVHKKLMEARVRLQNTKLSKSGHNKFAGYKYFELGDFLPAIQDIFSGLGLCGVVSYATDIATLTITDTETGTELTINSPMSTAALKGCHEVQNLGAVQTYIRRYLWVTALEIVEHDALDATLGASDAKPEPKPAKKTPLPVSQPTETPWAISIQSEDKWVESVTLAATKALDMATTKDDVLQIFKVNRPVFERLQTEDKATYDDLMAVFADYKNRFNKE